MEQTWENVVMLFTPDEGIQVANVRRFLKALFPKIQHRKMMKHTDGYFLIPLKCHQEVGTVVQGGLFFINWRPIIVKEWKVGFDKYLEIF